MNIPDDDPRASGVTAAINAILATDETLRHIRRKLALRSCEEQEQRIEYVYAFDPMFTWDAAKGEMIEIEAAEIPTVRFFLPVGDPLKYVHSGAKVVREQLWQHVPIESNAPIAVKGHPPEKWPTPPRPDFDGG